jgi:uncharacterized protein (DUF305 family)
MSRRTMGLATAGLLVGLLLLGSAHVALAGTPHTVTAYSGARGGPPSGSPFMGIANPAAPYDQRFMDEMIMHHQCAIMSAQMMVGQSARPQLRDLARRIVAGQRQQIDEMRAWRRQWYPHAGALPMDMGPMMDMMDMMGGMMGGSSGGGMMGGSSGGGMMGGSSGGGMMGRMFLRMMIPHHQLAIDMAQDALTNAQHPALKGLAQTIIQMQSAEIGEMEGYLKTWYGEGTTRDLAGPMRMLMQRLMGGMTT